MATALRDALSWGHYRWALPHRYSPSLAYTDRQRPHVSSRAATSASVSRGGTQPFLPAARGAEAGQRQVSPTNRASLLSTQLYNTAHTTVTHVLAPPAGQAAAPSSSLPGFSGAHLLRPARAPRPAPAPPSWRRCRGRAPPPDPPPGPAGRRRLQGTRGVEACAQAGRTLRMAGNHIHGSMSNLSGLKATRGRRCNPVHAPATHRTRDRLRAARGLPRTAPRPAPCCRPAPRTGRRSRRPCRSRPRRRCRP